MTTPCSISVLIPTRNRSASLYDCLRSIADQAGPILEVIVYQDAPDLPFDEGALRSTFPSLPLRVVTGQRRRGSAGSKQWLMEQAKGDLFLVLDDDTRLIGRDNLGAIIEAAMRSPEAGLFACKLLDCVDHQPPSLLLPWSRRQLRRHPELIDTEGEASYFLGAAHVVRRAAFSACGGYPADLFFGHEEITFAYRLLACGYSIRYLPFVEAHHFGRASASRTLHQEGRIYHSIKNRLALAYRFLPRRYWVPHMTIWLFIHGFVAAKQGEGLGFARGIRQFARARGHIARTPLPPKVLSYLRRTGGRLWY